MKDTDPYYSGGRLPDNYRLEDQEKYEEMRRTPPPPKTWLTEAVLVTIFCCQAFGVVAIVFAAMTDSAIKYGRTDEAERNSEKARKWVTASFVTGLITGIFYTAYLITKSVLNLD